MSNLMSRRAFLKCAGAVTVAAGAASVLSGCDQLVGTITGAGQGDQESIYARVEMGDKNEYVLVGLLNEVHYSTVGETGPINGLSVKIGIKNYRSQALVFHSTDVTNASVDGYELEIQTGGSEDNVFAKSDSVTYPADRDPKIAGKEGYLVFKPKEGESPAQPWSEIKFDLALNGKTARFTMLSNGKSEGKLVEAEQPPQ